MSDDMNDNEMTAPETKDGQDSSGHAKRHVILWTAVGGVVACVLIVWILLLPLQLQKERTRGQSGWLFSQETSVNGENLRDIFDETAQTFNQGISDLRYQAKLDAALAPPQVDPAIVEKLRARIEEEAAKKSVVPAAATVHAGNEPAVLPTSDTAKK